MSNRLPPSGVTPNQSAFLRPGAFRIGDESSLSNGTGASLVFKDYSKDPAGSPPKDTLLTVGGVGDDTISPIDALNSEINDLLKPGLNVYV